MAMAPHLNSTMVQYLDTILTGRILPLMLLPGCCSVIELCSYAILQPIEQLLEMQDSSRQNVKQT